MTSAEFEMLLALARIRVEERLPDNVTETKGELFGCPVTLRTETTDGYMTISIPDAPSIAFDPVRGILIVRPAA